MPSALLNDLITSFSEADILLSENMVTAEEHAGLLHGNVQNYLDSLAKEKYLRKGKVHAEMLAMKKCTTIGLHPCPASPPTHIPTYVRTCTLSILFLSL